MYRFFGKRVLGARDDRSFVERNIKPEPLQNMLALHGRALPENALKYVQLVEQWIAAAARQSEETSDPRVVRERLALALASEWPAKVLSERSGDRIVLSRQGKGDRVPGVWLEAGKQATLVVNPEGADSARQMPEVQEMIRRRESVLTIDAFQTGSAIAARDRSVKHFLAFNQTDDACRAQDILTALAFLKQSGYANIRLLGVGKAALSTLFAAAVAETPVSLETNLKGVDGSDSDFLNNFFVPGIQRAGGMKAARALLR
jgi:hypothetical protein